MAPSLLLLTESEVIVKYSVKISSKAMENMGLLDLEAKTSIAFIVDRGIYSEIRSRVSMSEKE